jgi:Rieske Fe-S protein
MERREFIKTACTVCLAGSAAAAVSTFLSSCASLPVYTTNVEHGTISVPLSAFQNGHIQIIRAQDILYDIALKKESNGAYSAYRLLCTHASNPLTFSGDRFLCSLHGSTFDQDGKVIHGPAARPLEQLKTRLTPERVIITL